MPKTQAGDKLKGISRRVAAKRKLPRERSETGCVAGNEPEAEAAEAVKSQEEIKQGRARNGQLLTSMMEVFIRGSDDGGSGEQGRPVVRAARLCENLWNLAVHSGDEGIRLAATKMIFDRVDGRPVERKEVKSMRIEGIVYIPEAKELDQFNAGKADT